MTVEPEPRYRVVRVESRDCATSLCPNEADLGGDVCWECARRPARPRTPDGELFTTAAPAPAPLRPAAEDATACRFCRKPGVARVAGILLCQACLDDDRWKVT